MAQADAELDNVEDGQVECHGSGAHTQHAICNGTGAPYMPHVALTQEELDRLHPSLVPPCDEQLDDLVSDERDGVYQKGLRLAEEIRSETSLQGRMRRPLLAVTEQQQHDDSSSQNRTRTIRPFGGGVISDATTPVLLPLLGTTATTITTTTTGPVAVVRADGVVAAVGEACVEEDADTMGMHSTDGPVDVTDTGFVVSRLPFGSCKPSVSSSHAPVLAP